MDMKATGTSWSHGPMYPEVLRFRANQVPNQAHQQGSFNTFDWSLPGTLEKPCRGRPRHERDDKVRRGRGF